MDHDADDLNEIVIPLMNIARRLPSGIVNEKEPNFQQICIKSLKRCCAVIQKCINDNPLNCWEPLT